MSAYQCSRCHVSALAGALSRDEDYWQEQRVRDLYARLNAANAASVQARYPDDKREAVWDPDPCFGCAMHHYPPIELYKAIQCFSHQACETEGWPHTALALQLECLQRVTLGRYLAELPEYERAPWGIRCALRGQQ